MSTTSPALFMTPATPRVTVGQSVLYVLGDEGGTRKGELRPAVVVAMRHPELPNLQVLGDGPNDDPATSFGTGGFGGNTLWRGSVPHGGPGEPGTWFIAGEETASISIEPGRTNLDGQPGQPIEHIMQFFAYAHLPPHLQAVSKPFSEQAERVLQLPRNPERTKALNKLLEAKDAAVRALLAK